MNRLFESSMKWAGYDIASAEEELAQVQSLSSGEFRKWKDEQKWKIARHHYENNALYRKKVGDHFPDRWEDLPVMTKSDFQDKLERLFSKGYNRKNTYIANTSGSSGHPFFFAKNKEAHAMDWALIKQRYTMHDLRLNSRQARFYGIPLEKSSFVKEKVKDWLMNRVRFPVFDLSDLTLEKYLDVFKRRRFVYIYGYTNSLVLFARFLIKRKTLLKEVCQTLRCCITTSEVLTHEDRSVLSQAFGVPVVNEYGASEIGLIAFESSSGEWILSEEILNIEVSGDNGQPLANGECGYLTLTDLDNKAMPFVRYRVGDIGSISPDVGTDSLNRKLVRLMGRENDNMILPSGRVSPGFTFYYISRSILESSGVLKEFIIRQTEINEFVFDVVTERNLLNKEISLIKKTVDLYLEPGLTIVINRVPKIRRPSSGKIKHFYSELQ